MAQTTTIARIALIAFATASLAACASKPKPAPVEPTPAPVEAPKPQPKPEPKVVEAPVGILPGSEQDFVVNVGDRVYFDLDQSAVRSDAQPLLDAQAAWLVRFPSVMVRIEGNADERGTREYNLALGARRAEAVRQYLVQRGVAPARIETISYGKERPLDAASTEEAWDKNRNARTAITSGAK